MSVSSTDFAARSGLQSGDFVYWYTVSFAVPLGTDAGSPIPIKKQAAAVIITGNGSQWVNLDGQAQAAATAQGSFFLLAGEVVLIGLELEADLTPHVFNGTGANTNVSFIVLRRRRRLESLPGQV